MSGRQNRLVKFQTLTAGDMSQSSLTSAVTNIQGLKLVGIQLDFTGSPVGTFAIQVSADYAQDTEGNVTNAGNWAPITFNPTPTASAGSPIYLDIQNISAPWIRTVYTKVSGTGTLNVFITGKM